MNRQAISNIFLSILLVLVPTALVAWDDQPSGEGNLIDTPEEINEYIKHHLQDSHDFTLFTDGETGTHYGFPLPVILWDDGLKIFSSSKFHHGETVAEVDGSYYKLYHSKIYKTNQAGDLEMDEVGHPHNPRPLDFSITKSVLGMLIAGLLLIWGFGSLAKSYKKGPLPSGFGRVLEPLVLYVRDDIAIPNIGEKKHRKFMGFLLTAFFYIWVLNLMGMTPLGFNVTGQIAVTVCLAAFTFFITQFSGNKHYWGHIFWMPGIPVPMKILLIPVEILGMFTKPFALLIRLFANMTAGHFVVMSLIALMITMKAQFGVVASTGIAFFLAFFISLIEILVAFLQAYIFTMLSALFIGMAVADHEEH
ncbi:MAG: F0F1 ATP synthase subunit A [Bacteroidota bacterium]